MGGGRYDGLIATMGGPSTAGVGWAAGIERLAMLLTDMPALARPIAIVPWARWPSAAPSPWLKICAGGG